MTFDNVFLITEEHVYSLQDVCQSGFLHSLPFCMPVPICMLLCMSASVGLHCVYLQVACLLYPLICLHACHCSSVCHGLVPACLSSCLSICMLACLFACMCASLFKLLRVCLFFFQIFLSSCLPFCICLSGCVPVFLSSCLHACLPVFLSVFVPTCVLACVPGCFLPVCLSLDLYLVTCPHA